MHEIAMETMSEAFLACWLAAGRHLGSRVDGGIRTWLRAHPYPPFREHLSFRLGNQIFFVRIEDVAGKVEGPGNRSGFVGLARDVGGHACILPMKQRFPDGKWVADRPDWGLLDALTGQPVDPVASVTDDKIEISAWEAQDMAVQIVRDHLEQTGYKLISWQGDPKLDPSIWFVGDAGRPEWVLVRAVRYPASEAARPANWAEIERSCAAFAARGHFASVALVSADQPFVSRDEAPVPLWRGHGVHVRFTDLV